MIEDVNAGTQEFYDLRLDSLEITNLLDGTLTQAQQAIKLDLEAEAQQIRTAWSCRDHIQNGEETGIDCGGSCQPCAATSIEQAPESPSVQFYPSPAGEVLHLDAGTEGIEVVRVYSLMGKLLRTEKPAGSTHASIHIGSLSPQVLWVAVTLPNRVEMLKVVKN